MQFVPEIDESASNVGVTRPADCGMPLMCVLQFTGASLGTRRRRHGDNASHGEARDEGGGVERQCISPGLRVSMVKLTQEIEALIDDAGSSGIMPLVSDECRASMSSGTARCPRSPTAGW